MKQMSKRLLALLLCAVLVLGQLPGTVWAEEAGIPSGSLAEEEVIPASDVEEGDTIPPSEPAEGEIPASEPAADEVIPSDDLAEEEVAPADNILEEELITVSSLAAGEVIAISNKAELKAIKGGLDGSYKLTGDITLTGEWTPLGDLTTPFSGTFDGDGYTISGLEINNTNSANLGLFGVIGAGGTVKNLTVAGSINSNKNYIGGIAGKSSGTIQSCVNQVNISGGAGQYIGGIVGSSESTAVGPKVIGCANLGTITGQGYIGGIAG